jgi:hypothetical protein
MDLTRAAGGGNQIQVGPVISARNGVRLVID